MSTSPRFLRHSDLNSPYLSNEGSISQLRPDLPLTKFVKTLLGLYNYGIIQNDVHGENSQISHVMMHRVLGGGGGEKGNTSSSDVSVFAIVILTLGLILITEGVLHSLDYLAHERKFFRKTLTTCYRELAILGIVEWMVHLYSIYGTMNYSLLAAFTDVHYLLFYTAIFNAIQSFVLYLGCRRQTLIWWVKTEELELNHYIELREEFDHLKQKLDMRNADTEGPTTIQSACLNFRKMITNPVLVRKYHRLLVQVRFHELRINIIRANKLPLKFRVSEYLKKCEQEVLMKFIKIGLFTWTALMTATSVIYFSLCMAIYATGGKELTKNVTKFLFYGVCFLFILLSFVTLQKVKWIFYQIMHTTLIDCGSRDEEPLASSYGASREIISEAVKMSQNVSTNQLDLFWGRNPLIIIGVIQLIQFGYAMLLSFVLVYWNIIKVEQWGHPAAMMFICLACFALFLGVTTRIVPRFILCTNIGQLMDTIKLRELLAKHRLEETIKKRRNGNTTAILSRLSLPSNKNCFDANSELPCPRKELISEESTRFLRLASLVTSPTENLPVKLQRHQGVAQICEEENSCNDSVRNPPRSSQPNDVKTSTTLSSVEECSPDGFDSISLTEADELKVTHFSSSVSPMCPTESSDTLQDGIMKKSQEDSLPRENLRSKRVRSRGRRCASEGVAAMRLATSVEAIDEEDHFLKLAKLVATSTEELPKVRSLSDLRNIGKVIQHGSEKMVEDGASNSTGTSQKLPRKNRPKKSFSEGVSFMTGSFGNRTSSESGSASYERDVISTAELHHCKESYLSPSFDGKSKEMNELEENVDNKQTQDNPTPTNKSHLPGRRINNGISTEGLLEEDSDDQSEPIEHGGLKKRCVSLDQSTNSTFHLLRSFLLSSSCKTVNVFATLSCFFLVGMRMNALLVDSHEIDRTMVFTPDASHLFWAEVSILILIVFEGLWRAILFVSPHGYRADIPICFAGAFGGCLGFLCVVLLLLSEASRSSKYGTFGHRSGAGIGLIEPFTSLIFLRFFSMLIGNLIVRWSKVTCVKLCLHVVTCRSTLVRFTSYIVGTRRNLSAFDNVSKQEAYLTLGKKTGTIIELWQMATGLFPEIVDQYGEFSGEMLQAMLGVPIESKDPLFSRIIEEKTRIPKHAQFLRSSIENNYEITCNASVALNDASDRERDVIHVASATYSTQNYTVENVQSHDVISKALDLPSTLAQFPRSISAVNLDHEHKLANSDNTFMLLEPDAPLILKMRRCERKLLPLLSSWMLVDIILTQFELVYLDALHCDHFGGKQEAASSALTSETGGGQDMMLRDVVVGRKIVGHVDLRALGQVKVLRFLSDSSAEAGDPYLDIQDPPLEEYWKPRFADEADTAKDPDTIKEMNQKRWGRVEEDQLQLCTGQGTLHLRFLCDLKAQEEKVLNNFIENAHMSEAMMWGNTLVNLRNIFNPIENINETGKFCELEIVSRDGESSTPAMKWRKVSATLMKKHRRSVTLPNFMALQSPGYPSSEHGQQCYDK